MEARAAVGRRAGAFASQVAESLTSIGREAGSAIKTAGDQAVQHIDHQQITEGAATGARLFDGLTEEKNKLVSGIDPNDPQYGQKVEVALKQWREETLEPALQKFSGGFTTEKSQAWADHFAATTRQHMFTATAADISTAAGIGVRNSIRTFTNSASNTAFNDPSAMPALLDSAEHSIGGMVGSSNLKGTDAARIHAEVLQDTKEKITNAAARGYIMKTGKVPDWVSDPQYAKYINGIELRQFEREAKAQSKTDFLQNRQIEAYQRTQDEQRVHAAANKNFSDNVSIDPATNRPIIKPEFFKQSLDLARKYPDAPNAATVAKTYLDWGEHQQNLKNEAPRTDPTVKAELMSRMFDPDKPTSKVDVLRAEADGKLSTHDGSVMRALSEEMEKSPIRGPLYQTAVEGAKERVGFTLMADGHERFANAMQEFLPEYLKAKRDGTLKPNALDLRDETSLIRQTLKRWEPSTQEKMQGHILKSMGVSNLGGLNLTGPNSTVTGVTVENKPITLPPLDKRETNKVYPTPRGPMKWTGADWVKP